MTVTNDQNYPVGPAAVIALNRWLEQIGVTPCTAWRWRCKGWLKTVNISGRQYLTQEAIDEFQRRAMAGEFAQEHKVPSRKEAMNHLGETCEERERQGGGGGGQDLPAPAAKITASWEPAPVPDDDSISSGGIRLPQLSVGITSEKKRKD